MNSSDVLISYLILVLHICMCVYVLGMYMTWIVFIKDGSENNITGKADLFINFKKRSEYSIHVHMWGEVQDFEMGGIMSRIRTVLRVGLPSLPDPPLSLCVQMYMLDSVYSVHRTCEPIECVQCTPNL